MKKKILPALLLSLLLCSCGSYPEETVTNTDSESRQEENISENTEAPGAEDGIEDVETAESEEMTEPSEDSDSGQSGDEKEDNASESIEGNSHAQEDKSAIGREEWIERALQEEEARRVMPELTGAEDIIEYIAKSGGKAYKGTYEGDTYYLYLTANYDSLGLVTPFVTVIKEKDTSKNPEAFGGLENQYGVIKDEAEVVLDANTKYKYGYNGSDFDRTVGDFIESDGDDAERGERIDFHSGTDITYTFREDNPNWQPGDSHSVSREIPFLLMEPEEAKYWYSQNALNGEWNDFMVYDGYHGDYYVRVEFTDGLNMMDKSHHYYMTLISSVEDLDTFNDKTYQIMSQYYSYNEFSRLEDDEFMLEFISDRQAVLTNKQTGTSALVKYYKGYLTESEEMSDPQYYFYDKRIVDRHDYTFEGKEYIASDGTSICFSTGSSWVNFEDITDVGERTVDVYYQGERSVLTAQAQIVDGKTLRVTETSTNTELLFIWSDDNHFVVQGTGDYLPDLDGMRFSYEENQLYGY